MHVNTGVSLQRDIHAETNHFSPNVDLEVENNDVLKANEFSIKFLGMHTPSSLPPNMDAMPKSVFF